MGVDAIPGLVEVGRAQADQLENTEATFRVLDIARPGWTDELPGAPFDCVAALAVFHHIPDFDLRAHVLSDIAGTLRPGGHVILSTWQFLVNERMRSKLVDWSEVDVEEENLDSDDYLLDWKRGGRGLRYCHLVDADEVRQLAAASGLRVRETFRAGGRERNLSLFAVLDK